MVCIFQIPSVFALLIASASSMTIAKDEYVGIETETTEQDTKCPGKDMVYLPTSVKVTLDNLHRDFELNGTLSEVFEATLENIAVAESECQPYVKTLTVSMEAITIGKKVGQGMSGSAFIGNLTDSETKEVTPLIDCLGEVANGLRFSNPNVLQVLGVSEVEYQQEDNLLRNIEVQFEKQCVIIYELAELGSLDKDTWLQKGLTTRAERRKMIKGLYKGLEYMHGLGFCHGDLFPKNVAVNKAFNTILLDLETVHPIDRGYVGWYRCTTEKELKLSESMFHEFLDEEDDRLTTAILKNRIGHGTAASALNRLEVVWGKNNDADYVQFGFKNKPGSIDFVYECEAGQVVSEILIENNARLNATTDLMVNCASADTINERVVGLNVTVDKKTKTVQTIQTSKESWENIEIIDKKFLSCPEGHDMVGVFGKKQRKSILGKILDKIYSYFEVIDSNQHKSTSKE
eukprot:Pgem_evm1s19405